MIITVTNIYHNGRVVKRKMPSGEKPPPCRSKPGGIRVGQPQGEARAGGLGPFRARMDGGFLRSLIMKKHRRHGEGMGASTELKASLNLPKTDFSMKANLPQNEPKTLARWEEMGL